MLRNVAILMILAVLPQSTEAAGNRNLLNVSMTWRYDRVGWARKGGKLRNAPLAPQLQLCVATSRRRRPYSAKLAHLNYDIILDLFKCTSGLIMHFFCEIWFISYPSD